MFIFIIDILQLNHGFENNIQVNGLGWPC